MKLGVIPYNCHFRLIEGTVEGPVFFKPNLSPKYAEFVLATSPDGITRWLPYGAEVEILDKTSNF